MKKLDTHTGKLAAQNRKRLDTYYTQFGKETQYLPFLQLVADVLDVAAGGGDWYLVVGSNRAHDALLLTVNQDGTKGYLSGLTLEELAVACEAVL